VESFAKNLGHFEVDPAFFSMFVLSHTTEDRQAGRRNLLRGNLRVTTNVLFKIVIFGNYIYIYYFDICKNNKSNWAILNILIEPHKLPLSLRATWLI